MINKLVVKVTMKYIAVTLLAMLICSVGYAAVSEESARLDDLRKAVENNPTRATELKYLEVFPATFEKFKKTFYGNNLDELYDVHEKHLALLKRLSQKYPKEVLSIWLGVATYGHWEADAIGILQHQLAEYGANNTRKFASALLAKSSIERLSIVSFLADVENHYVYTEYKKIMKNLQAFGYHDLYEEFALAKEQRMRSQDH